MAPTICQQNPKLNHATAKLVLQWKTCAFCSLDLTEVKEPSTIDLIDFDDFEAPSASVSFRTKQRQQNANPSEQAMYVPDAKPSTSFLTATIESAQQRKTSISKTKKQPSKSPTININIHLWLGSYYTANMDGVPYNTYTHIQ